MAITTITTKHIMNTNNDYGHFCIIDEHIEGYIQNVIIELEPQIKNDSMSLRTPLLSVCVFILYIYNYIHDLIIM